MSLPLGHKGMCLDKPGPCICNTLTDTICYHPGRGWHRTDRVACSQWNAQVDVDGPIRINGFGWSTDTSQPITKETSMIDHREGCAVVRTGRCTCAYLAQWDRKPEYTAPTWDENAPTRRTQPPITVTVEEQDILARPRAVIIHYENVPESHRDRVMDEIVKEAADLRGFEMESCYTLNGEAVYLSILPRRPLGSRNKEDS